MRRVYVCAGTGFAKTKEINEEASLLGKLLAVNNYTYIQSGYAFGLMGLTLHEFLKYNNNKNVEFFIPDTFYDKDAPILKQLVGAENFNAEKTHGEADRLRRIKTCDEIIILPGGTGTLEHLLYSNEAVKNSEHNCEITVVNVSGFYNGLIEQLKRTKDEGVSKSYEEFRFKVVDSVVDIPSLQQFMNENKKED